MKNTQQGFIIPLIIAIIAVLAIGGGVYAYHEKKVNDQMMASSTIEANTNENMGTDGSVSSNQPSSHVNTGVSATTNVSVASTSVIVTTTTSVSSDKALTDQEIIKAVYGSYSSRVKANQSGNGYSGKQDGDVGVDITSITKGDINGDGYQDAVMIEATCGGSCGTNPLFVINDKNTAHVLYSTPGFVPGFNGSGAAQDGITNLSISNGIISISYEHNLGDVNTGNNHTLITKKYKLQGSTFVEIMQ